MGILTLGLLGVAALFPVGGFYMQKAEIADRGAAIGQAVMNEVMARGMLNPGAWYVMVPPNIYGPEASQTFPSDGKYAPKPRPPQPARGTFGRPFAEALGEALGQSAAANDSALISKQFGSAFVIDPMGVAGMAFSDPSKASWNTASGVFPSSVYLSGPPSYLWQPWGLVWPVRRATFRQPSSGRQLDATMAAHYFQGNDDLATELPERDDRPATQNWDSTTASDGTPSPLARQWVGDYSWLLTVVPTTNADRNGMATNPQGHMYDVSVVVFYKRALPGSALDVASSSNGPTDFTKSISRSERAVRTRVLSSGLSGGELLLEAIPDGMSSSPFENLRAGQWIMLCGPHPNSNYDTSNKTGEPRFVLTWYQVVSIEGRDTRLNEQGTETPLAGSGDPERRLITVRGPQWPWQPTDPTDDTAISNGLCVGIFDGAVAVHTKTMRLESPRSSPVKFGASGEPTTTPNGYWL